MDNPFETIVQRLLAMERAIEHMAEKLNSVTKPETEPVLTTAEAAAFLDITEATLYRLVAKGDLAAMKPSKHLYFLKADLIDYLKRFRKATNAELSAQAESYCRANPILQKVAPNNEKLHKSVVKPVRSAPKRAQVSRR